MVTKTRGKARRARGRATETRDRDATRERILATVGRVLARDGFSALGVNAVAREAGVDKVLIYRYFGGIEGLLDAWGTTALGDGAAAPSAEPAASIADRAAAALVAFGRSARANPEALEVMRWELVEDNALTRRLAEAREAHGFADLERLGISREAAAALDLPAIAAVLSAGLLHIALRAKTAPSWLGIPIRKEQGWARLEGAATHLVRAALAGVPPASAPKEDAP
jgi:AcrR family transcriptional regulator